MTQQQRAVAHKYDISSVLNYIRNVPRTLHGYHTDPDTLVDIFILRSLHSFQNCAIHPHPPEVNDPEVLRWFEQMTPLRDMLYQLVKTPVEHSGSQASYIRQGSHLWLFYII